MKIELKEINKKGYNIGDGKTHYLTMGFDFGTTTVDSFDFKSLDEIETLELQLTNIVKQLYDYRQEHQE
jgi:hypothetical protein